MNWISRYLSSSVGKKQIMALSGASLILFLGAHLAGNLLFFAGAEVFNTYSHKLIHNPLIIPMELGLVVLFALHAAIAMKLTWENRQARPVQYETTLCESKQSLGSSTMVLSGIWTLVFLVIHICGIKFGSHYEISYNGLVVRDLFRTMIEYFHNKAWLAYYVISMIVLGVHLNHGFWSAFQTLGASHPKYTPLIKKLSLAFAILVPLGFICVALCAGTRGVN